MFIDYGLAPAAGNLAHLIVVDASDKGRDCLGEICVEVLDAVRATRGGGAGTYEAPGDAQAVGDDVNAWKVDAGACARGSEEHELPVVGWFHDSDLQVAHPCGSKKREALSLGFFDIPVGSDRG